MFRKTAATVAGCGLVLATSACGLVPGLGANPLDIIANVVQDIRAVDNYRAEVTMSGAVQGSGVELTSDLEYASDPEPTIRMATEIPDAGTGESVTLIRGTEILVQGEPALGQPEWVRLDLAEFGQSQPVTDPVAQIEQLLAGEDIEEVGDEDVNGQSTTRYSGSYPVAAALDEIEDAEAREMARQTYESMGVDSVPFDVWVASDGLPRRMTSEMGDLRYTIDFLEFDTDVVIDYPSADQIGDFEMPDLSELEEFDPFADVELPDGQFDDLDEQVAELEELLEDLPSQ